MPRSGEWDRWTSTGPVRHVDCPHAGVRRRLHPEKPLRAGGERLIAASRAALVGEIVSSATANNDRIHKLAGYAQAGVPLYLLIDSLAPGGPTVTLHSDPEGDTYRSLRAVEIGEPVALPAPFRCTLYTGGFPEA
ncbi:Uma2 family endonuclease [Streptomyces sp. NPDC046988]|uniref:Uma2 family endonuclease n=1 Tax=Streptomyces sp. NPDC046988 TaxID=3154922 RepID=UPI0033E63D49